MKKIGLIFVLILSLLQFSNAQFFVGTSFTQPTCNGRADGTATAIPIGGLEPYVFLWSTGNTISNIDNLVAGTYTVTVTDDTLAVLIKTIIVTEPTPITITIDDVTNSNYYPLNNGSIDISVAGGTLPYSFYWQDSIFNEYGYGFNGYEYFTEDISNIRGIKHLLHITDINNCEIDTTIDVEEILTMSVAYNIEDSACFASSASAIFTPTITGVDLPTLVFSNLEDTITIVDILAGPLFVTSDNDTVEYFESSFFPGINWIEFETFGGIAWQHIWFVDSADNPTTIHYTHQNINCFGENTGSISFSAEGNYGIFNYTINGPIGPVSSNSINSIPAGIYTLTATDQIGCIDNQTVEITEPPLLQGNLNIENEILCNGFNTGYLSVAVNGGTGLYNYTWSNGETDRQIYDLVANTYSISVTDSLGCTWNGSATLNEPDPLILSLIVSTDATYFDMNDGEVRFSVTGGTLTYTHYWQKNNEFFSYGHDTVLTDIGTGTYILETEDQNGCFDTLQVYIDYTKAPLEINLYEAFSPNGDGINDTYEINAEYLLDNPTVDIYSENNQHIYSSVGYIAPWDGTFNGALMPDGKYILIMTYSSGEKTIHSFILKS